MQKMHIAATNVAPVRSRITAQVLGDLHQRREVIEQHDQFSVGAGFGRLRRSHRIQMWGLVIALGVRIS